MTKPGCKASASNAGILPDAMEGVRKARASILDLYSRKATAVKLGWPTLPKFLPPRQEAVQSERTGAAT